jgi:hypothetical protein
MGTYSKMGSWFMWFFGPYQAELDIGPTDLVI